MTNKIVHRICLCLMLLCASVAMWAKTDTITVSYKLCYEDSKTVLGTTYSKADTYYAKYNNDTTYRIVISKYDQDSQTKEATFDGTRPYEWIYYVDSKRYSEQINEPGTFTRTHENKNGCNATRVLKLTLVAPPYAPKTDIENKSICYGKTYTWRGKQFGAGGQYRDSIPHGSSKPDTIYILNLNVWPKIDTTKTHLFACGGTITHQGKTYTRDTTVITNVGSSHGCDSIVQTFITFNTESFQSDTMRVTKEAYPIKWYNKTITRAGTYTYSKKLDNGCYEKYELIVIQEPIPVSLDLYGCLPDGVRFHNKYYKKDTVFQDTLFQDTLYYVTVRIGMSDTIRLSDTICEQQLPYILGDAQPDTIWSEGFHSHKETKEGGCHVLWNLDLRIRPSFANERDSMAVCERDLTKRPVLLGDTANPKFGGKYKGVPFTKDTILYDCHNNYFHLIVLEAQTKDSVYTLCEGDSLRFGFLPDGAPRWLTKAGVYFDTIPSDAVCDSIIRLELKVLPTQTITYKRTISVGDSTSWNGQWIYHAGVYDSISDLTDLIDEKGEYCHAVHRLTVSVMSHQEATICDNEQYRFGEYADGSPRFVNTDKLHYNTIHNDEIGYDSIIELRLHVLPTYVKEQTLHVADTMKQYIWKHQWPKDGKDTTATDTLRFGRDGGVYEYMMSTTKGCDSTDRLRIVVHPTYFITEKAELVLPGSMQWHGRTITEAGVYLDSLHTVKYGFDSIHQLTVTTHWEFQQKATICEGEYYDFFGKRLTYPGAYQQAIADTIFFLTLTVHPVSLTKLSALITREELPYIFNNKFLYASGMYSDTLKNRYMCDSIVHMTLVVTERISDWNHIPLCEGDTMVIEDQQITEPGEYMFTFRSASGERDSLYRVEVYTAQKYDLPVETVTITEGDTLQYGGEAITEAGHYDFQLSTIDGCDSLLHLNVNIRHITEDTICVWQEYVWRDSAYTEPGIYNDTVLTDDSICAHYYVLYLAQNAITQITHAEADTVCADETSFDIRFEYIGETPSFYNLRFDALAQRAGMEDIEGATIETDGVVHVALPVMSDTCYADRPCYVRPGRYTLWLELDNGACGVQRSDSINILIPYPSWIIEQNWNHVVAPLKAEFNGGYSFARIEWYVNGELFPTDSTGFLYNPNMQTGDEVYMLATRKGEEEAVPSCPILIENVTPSTHTHPVIIYPTHAPHTEATLMIQAQQEGTFAIYGMTGAMITHGRISEGHTSVQMPAVSGIYFVRTTQGTDIQTTKIILY